MDSPPPLPPVPFADFDFSFDPSLQPLLSDPSQGPPPSDLFSPMETTTLLGFLENFDFEFSQADDPFQTPAEQQDLNLSCQVTSVAPSSVHQHQLNATYPPNPSSSASAIQHIETESESAQSISRSSGKQLLSTPQKRLNHIISEQKRRNAIRDGYATLTMLLAPAGTTIGNAHPRRGRPRGSGARGRGRGKGKSGVLFRAVEYCQWLEEGCSALREEIERVESFTGARS